MAEKNYKVGEVIEVVYQAPNKQSGLDNAVVEIFLPNDQKDSAFPDEILTEIGSTGTYKGTFTPDAEGEWKVICHKADGDGQVVKRYSVGGHNVHSVGAKVDAVDAQLDTVESKIDTLDTKVGSLDTPPMVS